MDVYETVTNKIVAALESAIRYQRPWQTAFGDGKLTRPINAITRRPYRGVNVALLWSQAGPQEWATYRAWSQAGAQVRGGEKGTPVVFWKSYQSKAPEGESEGDDGEGETRNRLVARLYHVFNASQVDGWKGAATPAPKPTTFEAVAAAETFFANTRAVVHHGGDKAFYAPALDLIKMPPRESFIGSDSRTAQEAYYSVLGHETVHWTGRGSRCAREFGKRFGDNAYAFEELVAELGAAYLCSDLGIASEPRADHAAYVASWLRALRNDKRAVFTAASKAEQAVTFLHSLQPAVAAVAEAA